MNSPLPASSRTPQDPAAEHLKHRREAIAALGHELRLLVDAIVRTEASPETPHRLADGQGRTAQYVKAAFAALE
ncbi:hypothetical protein RM704_31815 [Streptomyces sp. DSM 3412]|uniref:Uncharacterized protein n=1 Tax=Streptomyces gottesmaniae TaxID=3075518 RepID=A0ABU2Z5W7_9ACTN|nr:hypothetical protein [Streptomyces sp. DSM 3412]MDT0571988.1 hypothetical protein [Streptomyces sp. DSM 3412]